MPSRSSTRCASRCWCSTADLRVRSANQSFYATFRVSKEDTVGRSLYELGNRRVGHPALADAAREVSAAAARAERLRGGARFRVDRPADDAAQCARHRSRRRSSRSHPSRDRGHHRAQASPRGPAREARRASRSRSRCGSGRPSSRTRCASAPSASWRAAWRTSSTSRSRRSRTASKRVRGTCDRARWSPKKLLALLDDASAEALRAGDIVEHLRELHPEGRAAARADRPARDRAQRAAAVGTRDRSRSEITLRLDSARRTAADLRGSHPDRAGRREPDAERHRRRSAKPGRPARRSTVRARTVKGMAELSVRDTGAGVSAEAAERMFEPFFTTKPHGLGMGLAISRSIIEAHRGPDLGGAPRTTAAPAPPCASRCPCSRRRPARKRRSP